LGVFCYYPLTFYQLSLYYAPQGTKCWWLDLGVGTIAELDTASNNDPGSGKWSLGPTAVALKTTSLGNWCSDQLPRDVVGRYLTSVPIITANWEASSDDKWTIPIGGGIG